ncbi:TonB-dependent receptor [Flagellimonas sp.]|uniref:TonB-dependent receptor n=1 Tax=Flagellimonas sp. TaxID=2058762 RepID=UPI003B50E317
MKKRPQSGVLLPNFKFDLKMKLSSLFILIVMLNLQANNTYSQKTKVSLDYEDVTTENVLDAIERDTDFRFVYRLKDVNLQRLVTINVKDKSIHMVLDLLFEGTQTSFKVRNTQVMLKKIKEKKVKPVKIEKAKKEEVQYAVNGTITDKDGQPLPGANIVEKGTANGVVSDFDGNFTLNVVDGNATLVISYIGFAAQEVPLNGQTQISVVLLEDTAGLDEVIVVGYGTQAKKEVTGAVAQVSGEDLTQAPVSTLTNTLTGRLPGLTIANSVSEPGREEFTVRVRGLSSFDADPNDGIDPNGALIVIDGIASADGLSRLDPNDIASVTVLKDASAAIYGARAAGGVVLVTTKRGGTGKPQFSYSSNIGFNTPIGNPKMADAAGYMLLKNFEQGWNNAWDPNAAPIFTDQEIQDARNGVTPSYDWIDIAYRETALQQNHNFSVRGGTDKVKYFASGRYLKQESLFEEDEIGENKQYNIRSNIDFALTDRLDLGIDLSGRQQNRQIAAQRDRIFSNASLSIPILEPFVNGDTRFPTAGRATQNSIAVIRNSGYDRDEFNVYNGQIKFNYKVPGIEGLSLKGFTAISISNRYRKRFQTPFPYYQLDGNGEIEEIFNGGSPFLFEFYSRNRQLTYNFGGTYARSFGEHNIDLLAQVEKQEIRYDEFGGFNDSFISQASDIFNSGSADRANTDISGLASETARLNYSGRANYNYKGKYLAQFLFRYDGSERFGEGKRFGFFPGVSAGWVVSEEGFFDKVKPITFLKLRASWGELGNDRIQSFQYLQRFVFGQNTVVNGSTVSGVVTQGEPNPEVTWETTESLNFGLDSRWFNNHLSLDVEVFKNNTKDILLPPNLDVPAYTGIRVDQIRQNLGTVENKGFEVAANYTDQIDDDFYFSIGGNAAFVRNKVTEIRESRNPDAPWQDQTGKAFGGEVMYQGIGVFQTQAQLDDPNIPKRGDERLGSAIRRDVNGDGVITDLDRVRSDKSTLPEWTYGITTSVNYKNFDFNMLWQGAAGAQRRLRTLGGDTQNALSWFVDNTWNPDNPNANFPAFTRDQDTDFFLLNTRYIRLKTVELGYTLPESAISTVGLSKVRLYVSGYNLVTFDKLSDFGFTDPEQTQNFGWDFPSLATVNLGVNVTF